MKNLRRRILYLTVAFSFTLATKAHAQEEMIGPESGDFSLAPQIGYTYMSLEDYKMHMLFGFLSAGYYVLRPFEVGLDFMISASGENISDQVSFGLSPFAVYHFLFSETQRLAPFVGVGGGFQVSEGGIGGDTGGTTDDTSTDFLAKFFGGLDYFVTEKTSLRLRLEDQLIFLDQEGSTETLNMLVVLFGINIFFD